MILADTSIWIDHLARGEENLFSLLEAAEIVGHAFVTAELMLGSLADPFGTRTLLQALPQAQIATQDDLLALIDGERLARTGIGFVDAHLLASCRRSGATLWTRDKRLAAQAKRLGCAWAP